MKKFNYTEEQILEKIESIYKSENGKKFISHLIRSFFPINKAVYLWDDPKDKSKLKCCITEHPLMSKATALKLSMDNAEKSIKLFTAAVLATDEKEKKITSEAEQKNLDEVYQGKMLAVSSEESDKYFAPPVFEVLKNWLTHKILTDDKHIFWLMKSHRKNEALKYAESKNIPITQDDKRVFNKAVNNPSRLNLEDNVVLKNLSEKFKQEQNKNNEK
jgi:hypothetical protein